MRPAGKIKDEMAVKFVCGDPGPDCFLGSGHGLDDRVPHALQDALHRPWEAAMYWSVCSISLHVIPLSESPKAYTYRLLAAASVRHSAGIA